MKDECGELKRRPLPLLNATATAADYHTIPIEHDPARSTEPLVDVAGWGLSAESYYGRVDGLNPPYYRAIPHSLTRVWCRRSVVERLCEVNAGLRKEGVELHLLDGYRPVRCQQALWDYFMELARAVPGRTEAECCAFVGQYWSNPSGFDPGNFRTWPTHATGGAVDLTLKRAGSGELLYMGGVFDDTSAVSHTRFYEGVEHDLSASAIEARQNRRLLYWSMLAAGFASYAFEWWHFDLGTQMWVMNRGLFPDSAAGLRAYYGLAVEPENIS